MIRMKVGHGQLAMSGRSEVRKDMLRQRVSLGWWGWLRDGPTRETETWEPKGTAVTQSLGWRESKLRFHSKWSSFPNQCPWREKWRKNKVILVDGWMKNRLKIEVWGGWIIFLYEILLWWDGDVSEQQRVSRLRRRVSREGWEEGEILDVGKDCSQQRQSFSAQDEWGPSSE